MTKLCALKLILRKDDFARPFSPLLFLQSNLLWLSSWNFLQGGGQNLLLCKFILLCYCFRTKFQGGKKFSGGGAEESQYSVLFTVIRVE